MFDEILQWFSSHLSNLTDALVYCAIAGVTLIGVGKPSAFPCCKCQILFYSHSRCSSPHRILIQTTDGLCTYMLGHKSNVLSIQHDHTGICKKISTDRIKQSGFTSSIGTDDRCKIALLQIQG